jgi:hypothetical protein
MNRPLVPAAPSPPRGAPASKYARPGSGGPGNRPCRGGPHYFSPDAERVGATNSVHHGFSAPPFQCITISVHHSDRKHHHDGRAERAHDRQRYDVVAAFHCRPRVLLCCGKQRPPDLVRLTTQKSFLKKAGTFARRAGLPRFPWRKLRQKVLLERPATATVPQRKQLWTWFNVPRC